jgi:hypothetical protein
MEVIGTGDQLKEGLVPMPTSPELACHALLPLGEVHVPNPPGSGFHKGSYYSWPRQMTENNTIHPVPGFDPTSQNQMLCSVWRPRLMTFKTVLETMPRRTPDRPKVQRWMIFCFEEIVDVDGH